MKLVDIDECPTNEILPPKSSSAPSSIPHRRPPLEFLLSASTPNNITAQNALILLNQIKDNLTWNDNLEVVIRNQVIPDSNIVSLIIHAVENHRNKKSIPIGWDQFNEFLSQTIYSSNSVLSPKTINSWTNIV